MRPAVISFYSYKGGVGRTTLASNMAVAFARKGKTLLWDLDVEAPGLHYIEPLRPSSGLVKRGFFDWLQTWQSNQQRQPGERDLQDFAKLPYQTALSNLWVLPAHADEANPAELYFGIDWSYMLEGDPPPARALLWQLIAHLGHNGYRHVLIDARTGLTDLGALIAGVLPDATVLVGGYGVQNLRGLGRVYRALATLEPDMRESNSKLQLFPVASPIPLDNTERVAAGKKLWRTAFGLELSSLHEIRYEPSLSFGEQLLILETHRDIAKDYEGLFRKLSDCVDRIFADEAEERAQQRSRPDIFDREHRGLADSRTAQGKRFEDKVADLLRLLGYNVESEQLVGPDRVDLIARIESGLDTLTYLVECKDRSKAVGKDIVELLGLWLSKPAARTIHARGMLVANSYSPAALTSAKDLGITATTPTELERRLLDFEQYLHQLVAEFEQSPLATAYVDQYTVSRSGSAHKLTLNHSEVPPPSLVEQGLQWAAGRGSRLWVILGDYGTGKTAFTEKLCYELAKRAREDGDAPVPLRVSLREFANKVRLEDLLAERWLQATGQRKNPQLLLHLLQRGRMVLIFDAFDEMGIATAGRSVLEQFRMLVSVTADAGHTPAGNRVLITCREQFFREHGEALKTAVGDQDRLAPLEDLSQRFDGDIQMLATFTEAQIREFLLRRLGEERASKALEFLTEQGMLELGDRPQLLDIIIASLPDLQQQQARGEAVASIGELYRLYTNRWLDVFKPVERQSSSETLRSVLEALAHVLWQRVGNRIHYGDLFALLKQRTDLRGQLDPNQLDVELRTAAFLSRTPDGLYGFSHRSFLEYFLARHIERAACHSQEPAELVAALDLPRLNPECCRFVHDLAPVIDAPRRSALRASVRRLLLPGTDAPLQARVNALLIGYRLFPLEHSPGLNKSSEHRDPWDASIEAWIPQGADLAGADLSDLSLVGIHAPKADLRSARLENTDLDEACLVGAKLNAAQMSRARLSSCNLSQAILVEANLSDVEGTGTTLAQTDARDSIWLNACLRDAVLDDADFSGADLRRVRLPGCTGLPQLEGARLHGLTAPGAKGWPTQHGTLLGPSPECLTFCPISAHWGSVRAVVFSPDGRRLLSGGGDGRLCLWDADGGQSLRVIQSHSNSIRGVAFSPDGTRLLSGGDDGRLSLWDIADGRCLQSINAHQERIITVAFNPTGTRLLSAGRDGRVYLWDAVSGHQLGKIEAERCMIQSAAFNSNGTQVLTGTEDGRLCLWDLDSGQPQQIIPAHQGCVSSVAFSADDSQLLSGGKDGRLCLWDAASGKAVWGVEAHKGRVSSIAFSSDGTRLISGGRDYALRLWDPIGAKPLWGVDAHANGVSCVAFGPDGTRALSASDEGLGDICHWDTVAGQALRSIRANIPRLVGCIALSPDGTRLLSASGSRLCLMDSGSGTPLWEVKPQARWIFDAVFSPDGKKLLTREGNRLCLRDVANGRLLQGNAAPAGLVTRASISPDGTRLVAGAEGGLLCLWDIASSQTLRTIEAHEDVSCVTFSPDGKRLLSGGRDGQLCLWDVASGESVRVIESHAHNVTSVAFSPDGTNLLSGGNDGRLCLWDAASGQSLHKLDAHREGVSAVSYSPDDNQLLSGGYDGWLRWWDRTTGHLIAEVQTHLGPIRWISFCRNRAEVVVSAEDPFAIYEGDRCLLRAYPFGFELQGPRIGPSLKAPSGWLTIDYRHDPRGLWRGQGTSLDVPCYHDADELIQPWPWVPRYWSASEVPALQARDVENQDEQ